MDKKCFKCGEVKSLNEFYKHKQMGDGHLNKCKTCTKNDSNKTRSDNLEYYREYDRKRANLPHRVEKRKEIAERWATIDVLKKRRNELSAMWKERNREKRAAHVLVGSAIKCGRLIRLPCAICGNEKSEAHHEDYTKPLEVMWLCRKHHMELHKRERENDRKNK